MVDNGVTPWARLVALIEPHYPKAIFAEIRSFLEVRGLLLKRGTIVDATILHAPSST